MPPRSPNFAPTIVAATAMLQIEGDPLEKVSGACMAGVCTALLINVLPFMDVPLVLYCVVDLGRTMLSE